MKEQKKIGVDVSRWNEINDYQAVRESGVEFAIVKVINAKNQAEERFYKHMQGFKAAGVPVIGGYHYCYANTVEKAKRAADSFVNIGKPQGIDFMWLDLEDASMKGLGNQIVDIVNTYRQAAGQAEMEFGIYTGASFYKPYLKPYMEELGNIPFWWARYPYIKERTTKDEVPSTDYLPKDMILSGWQYSSKGKIDGVKGYIDLNVWFEKE